VALSLVDSDRATSLLGPWAEAPVPDVFTFGVELEVAVHGMCNMQCVADHLAAVGVSDPWKVVEDDSIKSVLYDEGDRGAQYVKAEIVSPVLQVRPHKP
jgi:hypothetical protein